MIIKLIYIITVFSILINLIKNSKNQIKNNRKGEERVLLC